MAAIYTAEKIIKNSTEQQLVDGFPNKYKNNYDKDLFIPVNKNNPSVIFKSTALIKIVHIITYENGDDETRYYWQEASANDGLDCSAMEDSQDSCFVYIPKSNWYPNNIANSILVWNRDPFSCTVLPITKFIYCNNWEEKTPSVSAYPIMKIKDIDNTYRYYYRSDNYDVPEQQDNHTALLMPVNAMYQDGGNYIKDTILYPIRNFSAIKIPEELGTESGFTEENDSTFKMPFSAFGLSTIEQANTIANKCYYNSSDNDKKGCKILGKQATSIQTETSGYRQNYFGAMRENFNFTNVTNDWFILQKNGRIFVNSVNGYLDKLKFSNNNIEYNGDIIFNTHSWFGNDYIIDNVVVGRKTNEWSVNFDTEKNISFGASTTGDYQFAEYSYQKQEAKNTINKDSFKTLTTADSGTISVLYNDNLYAPLILFEGRRNDDGSYWYEVATNGEWGPLSVICYSYPIQPKYRAWLYSNECSVNEIFHDNNENYAAFAQTNSTINPTYNNKQNVNVTITSQYNDWRKYKVNSQVVMPLSNFPYESFIKNKNVDGLNTSQWLVNNVETIEKENTSDYKKDIDDFTDWDDWYGHYLIKPNDKKEFQPFKVTWSIAADYIPDITEDATISKCNNTSCAAHYCATSVDQNDLDYTKEGNFYYQWLDVNSDLINIKGPAVILNNNTNDLKRFDMVNSTKTTEYRFYVTYDNASSAHNNSLRGANFIRFNLSSNDDNFFITKGWEDDQGHSHPFMYQVRPFYWKSNDSNNYAIQQTTTTTDEAVVFVHLSRNS